MIFPELNLFPADSVAVSLTTTVWVGVMVVAFFNLRFGWTLSGLVIPGYLVPLIMCKPTAAVVIFCEAVLTYWIVYLVSEGPRRLPYWCSFFGRDRFLALILGSVLVRVVLEGWFLPWLGPIISEQTGMPFDYRNDLHSYGLIIVSLMANYFWKPGVFRGLTALATTIGVTYLIVRFPLVESTNLNVSDISHLYEDISASLLASPKAYVVILTSALIASWLNLKYSWDYNGILVPSLLALLWHDPIKVFASILEAGILLCIASLVLRSPLLRKTTMEGARRTALFFTICFLYRLMLCHVCQRFFPVVHVTDYFGFGYLLTTLLAIKAHQKTLTIGIVKTTLQASTIGAVVGNGFGFLLTLIPMGWLSPAPSQLWAAPSYVAEHRDQSLVDVVRTDKLILYTQKKPESYLAPTVGETTHFAGGIESLAQYVRSRNVGHLDTARARFRAAHFELSVLKDRYLYLRERGPPRGWGMFVFDMQNPDGMVVEVPFSLDEGTLESGLCLFQEMNAGVLAIGGSGRYTNSNRAADVLTSSNSLFPSLHRALPERGVLQVRGYSENSDHFYSQTEGAEPQSTMWVAKQLPTGVNLNRVKSLTSDFDIRWESAPEKNVLREQRNTGFAELWLVNGDRRRLLTKLMSGASEPSGSAVESVESALKPWLIGIRDQIARKNSNLYQPAKMEELLLFDEEVLRPLIQIAADTDTSRDATARLESVAASASILGYSVVELSDPRRQQDFLILCEQGQRKRYWGTYIFRRGLQSSNIVEVPRPLAERRTFEFGIGVFQRLNASAMFVSGSHPAANLDGSSDLLRYSNKTNAFGLVHQVFLREMKARPMLVIQSRSIRSPVLDDVVMGTDDGATGDRLSPLKQELYQSLLDQGLRVSQVDGRKSTAGYEVGILMQATSLNHSERKEFVSLWVSPSLRVQYQSASDQRQIRSQLDSLGIQVLGDDLVEFTESLQTKIARTSSRDPKHETHVERDLRPAVEQYLRNRDVVLLASIIAENSDCTFGRIEDRSTGQIFLVIQPSQRRLPLVVNVTGYLGDSGRIVSASVTDGVGVREYLIDRATWLVLVEGDE